jgi:peroxiredoxin
MNAHMNGILAPLPVGTRAPDFTLTQVVYGTQVQGAPGISLFRLRRVGRTQALVLVFYPLDWEPVSREQLTLYQGYTDTFHRLGARLLGISSDHVYSHDAFAHDERLQFPLLADFLPRGQVARQYGVWREAQEVSARALFILDRKQIIRFGKVYPDQLNPGVGDLLTTLEALAAEDEPSGRR